MVSYDCNDVVSILETAFFDKCPIFFCLDLRP